MTPLHDIEFILLFDHIRVLGKVSSVISKINSEIVIEKYFDLQQLKTHDFSNSSKTFLLVSENKLLGQLDDFDIEPSLFKDIICIDIEETKYDFEIIYINQKLLLTGLMTRVNELIKAYLPKGKYIATSYKNLVINKTYPCDFYIKLNDNKYIKVLASNEIIESEFIQKYIDKDISYFYIPSESYDKFAETAFRKKTVFKKKEEEVNASIDSIEALHTYTKNLGISEIVIRQAKALHEQIEKNTTSKIVKRLLGKLKKLEGSFLYNHSYETATIALTAGKKFNWFTLENQEKVYMGEHVS